jgi:hypothetical protein
LTFSSFGRSDYVTAKLASGSNLPQIIGPGAWVDINNGKGGAANERYYPGPTHWVTTTASVLGAKGTSFTSFCIELTQEVGSGKTYQFQLENLKDAPNSGGQHGGAPIMGADKAKLIRELWAADFSSIGTNGTKGAAFQLAIWKIEYDGGSANTSFSTGNFRASGNTAAIDQATAWLDAIGTNLNLPKAPGLVGLGNPSAQDQLTQLPGSSQISAAPAPASVYLAGLGGLVLVAYCLWTRRPALGVV